MPTQTDITEDMLHAFVDGQLGPQEHEQVEAWLNDNPAKAAEMLDWVEQNRAIAALFPAPETVPDLPSEPTTIELPAPANDPSPPRFGWARNLAAGLVLLAVGLGSGWLARGTQSGGDIELVAELVGEAMLAHTVYAADPHRPVEVAAEEEELLIRWLSNRVGRPLTAPDLSSQGFDLVGGRLLSVSEGPAAQFMYEDETGRRITLFAVRGQMQRMAEFTYQQDGPTNSFYWQDENLRYAVVGDVDRDTLNKLAVEVFNALS